MQSYRHIDTMKLRINEDKLYYDDEILLIKTPKIISTNVFDNKIKLYINNIVFKNLIGNIDRLYSNKNIVETCDNLILHLSPDCKFFDKNTYEIDSSALQDENNAMCIITVNSGVYYLFQYMKLS